MRLFSPEPSNHNGVKLEWRQTGAHSECIGACCTRATGRNDWTGNHRTKHPRSFVPCSIASMNIHELLHTLSDRVATTRASGRVRRGGDRGSRTVIPVAR